MNKRPNHKDDCDGTNFYYSGEGYNRVKVCSCGAEDHAPSEESINKLMDSINKIQNETQHPS